MVSSSVMKEFESERDWLGYVTELLRLGTVYNDQWAVNDSRGDPLVFVRQVGNELNLP